MRTGEFFDKVDQLFHDWKYDHPRILYSLIRALKPIVAVEVGTFRGYAAAWMAQGLRENKIGVLYCIDDFSEGIQKKYDEHHWEYNLTQLEVFNHVKLLKGKSKEVNWPKTVDFAYIDGWHSFETVEHDFLKASSSGAKCICLDDTKTTIGPSMLVQKILAHEYPYWTVTEIFSDCGLAICTRVSDVRPVVNFSQELDTGTVMTDWDLDKRLEHLFQATSKNDISYIGFDFGWDNL